MPRQVTYRCPDCSGQFDFLHHPSDEPPPSHCPLCKSSMTDAPEKLPVLKLNIATHKSKGVDSLYRRMESASQARAEEAAEVMGVSVSDVPDLKMTDMKDNLREGDTTASHRINPHEAAGRLSTATSRPEMQHANKEQAAGWAEQTTAGPNALAARSVLDNMQSSGRARAIMHGATLNGQMGKA